MKILQIADGYGKIGLEESNPIERVIFEVSRNLVQLGHDVTILERKDLTQNNSDELYGINIVRLDKKRASSKDLFNLNSPTVLPTLLADGIKFSHSINKYIKTSQKIFDIIHFHLPLSCIPFFLFSSNIWRSRIVYTYHGNATRLGLSIHSNLPPVFHLFHPDVFLIKHAARVAVLNTELRQKIIDYYNLDASRMFAIHNAIDSNLPVFPQRNYGQSTDLDFLGKKVILFVGTIVPVKGVEYLIRAANILVNVYHLSDLMFIIIGPDERNKTYSQHIKQLVAQHGLLDYVKLLGYIDRKALGTFYNRCDIFVLPSLDEGFGLVITEALSFGKPVVGTNVGGIPIQIVDHWNGFIVEPANPTQLAEKLKYLLTNEPERVRMGKNSKIMVEQKFNWKAIATEYEKLYLSMK
jgi:glycosyltransferase involved in cell wall biosynthesis